MTNIRRVRTMMPDWNSMRPFSAMMDQLMRSAVAGEHKMSVPFPLDIRDEDDRFIIEAALPGVAKEDVQMIFADNVLKIAVEQKSESETSDEEKNYVHREMSRSYMERQVTFEQVNGDAISATMENGILSVVVPKLKVVDTAKRIVID